MFGVNCPFKAAANKLLIVSSVWLQSSVWPGRVLTVGLQEQCGAVRSPRGNSQEQRDEPGSAPEEVAAAARTINISLHYFLFFYELNAIFSFAAIFDVKVFVESNAKNTTTKQTNPGAFVKTKNHLSDL